MTVEYKTRDPFFDDREPDCDTRGGSDDISAETWTRLRLAAVVDARLPSILIWIAGGMTQAEVAERLDVAPQYVSKLIQKLRTTSLTIGR